MPQYIMVVEHFPVEGSTTEFRMEAKASDLDGQPEVPFAVTIDDGESAYDGEVFVKTGRYAVKGDRFAYRNIQPDGVRPLAEHTVDQYDPDRWEAE